MGFERTLPRAIGIMQYVQYLSQPSSILIKARVRSSKLDIRGVEYISPFEWGTISVTFSFFIIYSFMSFDNLSIFLFPIIISASGIFAEVSGHA